MIVSSSGGSMLMVFGRETGCRERCRIDRTRDAVEGVRIEVPSSESGPVGGQRIRGAAFGRSDGAARLVILDDDRCGGSCGTDEVRTACGQSARQGGSTHRG